MSLLGIDVGTTGCKACAFTPEGKRLATAYREYDVIRPRPGEAELDARQVWSDVCQVIREVASVCRHDPVTAVAVSSLGEAVVPVTRDRTILGNSILNFDGRGAEYVQPFAEKCPSERLYQINGNGHGNHYTLTKLLWMRDHQPETFAQTYKFLHWGAFVGFMLGAEAAVDFSLANRTLLFDLDQKTWSGELLNAAGLDVAKLPTTVPSGTVIGEISPGLAGELLPGSRHVAIVSGAHDQCANALGCGVIHPGDAMFGMGTYFCIAPVFSERPRVDQMLPHGLNTEHHAVPDRFVSFLYNHGGSLLKWFRDVFARELRAQTETSGGDVYELLLREASRNFSSILVLPHFAPTGPPEFVADSSGVMIGLKLETERGDILRGIMEGTIFYLRQCVEAARSAGIPISAFRAVGGGSRSDTWLQIAADILARPVIRMKTEEAGALGSAILAGVATKVFQSIDEAIRSMTQPGNHFEPDNRRAAFYEERYCQYAQVWPLMKDFLRQLCGSPNL